jgi:S-adenosylmethionine:tRNA ribosyltransferase-isomerase
MGEEIVVGETLRARVEGSPAAPDGRRLVRLISDDASSDLEKYGHVPLPPYLRRSDTAADRERYQTVFAQEIGSVAAPTAGLHFTHDLLGRLQARQVERVEIVLHVGPATFLPVRTEDVSQHRLPPEPFEVSELVATAVGRARARGGRVVAVGTTSTRALEAAATDKGEVRPIRGETDLVIVPGFRFRVVDVLLTNFHLPRSSLLLLVSAFAGVERTRQAYAEAIRQGYRFYSYGDAMLVE